MRLDAEAISHGPRPPHDMKAEATPTIHLRQKSLIGDYMVASSGRSQRHVGSVADRVVEDLHKAGVCAHVEGMPHCDWVLIDAGDVIVHAPSGSARYLQYRKDVVAAGRHDARANSRVM